ncbi:MAG: hypothetical protein PHC62_00395 [Candidatus Izemoplasmatales bacterium]|nr:hypothetical protein [Candidatus Izemoplasmatales bacterium]
MALFEHAMKHGIIEESLSYSFASMIKSIKWSLGKNLMFKCDFDGLRERLTGLLENCKDAGDVAKFEQNVGIEDSVVIFGNMLKLLSKQQSDDYEKDVQYKKWKAVFGPDQKKNRAALQSYLSWLKGPLKSMINKKKAEVKKK